MSDLTGFDILVLGSVGIFAVLGLMRGFVGEVISLLAWVAGFVAVNLFFDEGRAVAAGVVGEGGAAPIIAVLLLFFGTFALGKLLARALGGRVRNSVIGPIDRVLGLGFGALKGLLLGALAWAILTLLFDVALGRDERPEWLAEARTGPLLGMVAAEVREFVRERREGGAPEEGYERQDREALDTLFEDAGDGEL